MTAKPKTPTTAERFAEVAKVLLEFNARFTRLEELVAALKVPPVPTADRPASLADAPAQKPVPPPAPAWGLKPASERRPGDAGFPPAAQEHLDEVTSDAFRIARNRSSAGLS